MPLNLSGVLIDMLYNNWKQVHKVVFLHFVVGM